MLEILSFFIMPISFFFINRINYWIFISKNSVKNEKLSEDIGGYLEERLYKIKTVASFVNFDYEINNFNNKLNVFLLNSKKKQL